MQTFSLLLLSSLLAAVDAHAAANPNVIYCDMLSHLARKAHIVEQKNDLLGGASHVRLVTVGISSTEIVKSLDCRCERQQFDSTSQIQPSIVRAWWTCEPELLIMECSDPRVWTPVQLEEYGIRMTGHAEWGQVLPAAGWTFSGWTYHSTWFVIPAAVPFAVVSAYSQLAEQPGVRFYNWAATSVGDISADMRNFIKSEAVRMRQQRACTRCYNQGYEEATRVCQASQTAVSLLRSVAPTPPQIPVSTLRSHFQCPVTLETIRDPCVSLKSGQSFECEALRRSVRLYGRDPTSNVPMTLDDIVPNRALKAVIDASEEHDADARDDDL